MGRLQGSSCGDSPSPLALPSAPPLSSPLHPLELVCLLFPCLWFPVLCVMAECLRRVSSTQHGSPGDGNHHPQQQEVDKMIGYSLPRALQRWNVSQAAWRLRLDQHLTRMKPWPLGLSLAKGNQYLGTINSSFFAENWIFSMCQMKKKMKFFHCPKGSCSGSFYLTGWFFFSTSWVWRLHTAWQGRASAGRNLSWPSCGFQTHMGLAFWRAFNKKTGSLWFLCRWIFSCAEYIYHEWPLPKA